MQDRSPAVAVSLLMSALLLQFRNPKASLHTRLSDLIKYLQKKGERPCQEFYRALQINAEHLYNDLPSRKILSKLRVVNFCISVLPSFQMRFRLFEYFLGCTLTPSDWNFPEAIRGFTCIVLVDKCGQSKTLIVLKYKICL